MRPVQAPGAAAKRASTRCAGPPVHRRVEDRAVLIVGRMGMRVDMRLLDAVLDDIQRVHGGSMLDAYEGIAYAVAYAVHAQTDPAVWR